ncbi:xaa-Pro aminopeptidase 1-like [Physella acuta]|uniref:xaa-Pro aminopeptidase 1-like n=1 Tax=Physella acuta TaxID=109671 RepID=UPI0027DD3AB7|nr:xaa-Pro aminopeptidase 1-like [Physella acuta]XP_059160081.1 xaa-Pro aminopeptidase 1-like [Physella acuta]
MSKNGILSKLRALMHNHAYVSQPLHAYIIPTGDAHQSEYVAECDNRRSYITGFTGSSGTAIVTTSEAALWTDGRYYLQAEQQLSNEWKLMKQGLPETPTESKWLNSVLPVGGRVGCDPRLMSIDKWKPLHKELQSFGHELVSVDENLVNLIWSDRPDEPHSELIILTEAETGKTWQQKVSQIREKMIEEKISALVVTALDEIAWLFNLRGADIIYNPVFFSFAILTLDSINLFINEKKLSKQVLQHLSDVQFHPYESVYQFLSKLAESEAVSKIWISGNSSYAIYNRIPKQKIHLASTPLALMKCVKTEAEMKGMEHAQVKDAVALCEFFVWLEKEVSKGSVTEVSAAKKAEFFRSQQENFISLSFDTISSIGPNGAIIHYKPSSKTDSTVTTDQIYLIDSGAQYREGTTDTTRTIHLGTPSKHEQECFTRVLKGHINLASAIFPPGIKGHMLDTLARQYLWEVGLDYRHGTGHGVGAFLNVHEGPCGISFRTPPTEANLEENMVLTDEPGYYEDGKFGIRIENCMKVIKAVTKHKFGGKDFLTFEPITLVPIQRKMIDASILTAKETEWLNNYHSKVRQVVGDELKRQNKTEVYQWLIKATETLG